MIEANPLHSEYAQQRLERERRKELMAEAAKMRMLKAAFPRQPGLLERLVRKIFKARKAADPAAQPKPGAVIRPVYRDK